MAKGDHVHRLRNRTLGSIQLFLTLAIDSKLRTPCKQVSSWGSHKPLDDSDIRLYLDTIAFLRKYKCTTTLSTFGTQIPLLMMHRVITPPLGFGLGASVGDGDARAASLTFYHHSEGFLRRRCPS